MKKVGDWNKARAATTAMAVRMERATNRATKQEGQLFRALVVKAFNTSGRSNGKQWPKLAGGGQKRNAQGRFLKSKSGRKGSKPLIDSGQLRGAVSVVERGDDVFVGVPNNKRRANGQPLAKIAEVHENGKVIAQQRGGKIVLITIPKRSFIQATADKHFQPGDVRKRYLQRVAHTMGPGWGEQVPKAAALAKAAIAETKK